VMADRGGLRTVSNFLSRPLAREGAADRYQNANAAHSRRVVSSQ